MVLYTWDKISYEADGVTPALTKYFVPHLLMHVDTVDTQQAEYKLNGLLSYDKAFGDHVFGIMAGVTKEKLR
jgi:hypothetical protein